MSANGVQAASAFFAQPVQVDRAVSDLVDAGVPRDLIEVVVSPAANRAHFEGRAHRLGSQTMRYAGAGALIGLLVGVVLSLEIILAFPGAEPPARGLSIAQLLGPNVAMLAGLVIGAFIGALVRRPAAGPLARASERDEILVVARAQPQERVPAIVAALEQAGGHETVTQADLRRGLGRWRLR